MEDQNIPNPAGAIELGPADIDHLTAVMTALLEKELTEEAVVRFSRLRSPDQAEVMTRLGRGFQAILLDRLTHRHLGEIIEELEPEVVVELTQNLEPHELSQALDEASPETAADVRM